ncbi:jg13731 [Pararge aegeria aegeria]|uniref:Jg13731 protein n=1 Tax=Pararge aegeria aegeria TaxID=348720 RepID=A0A8S4RMJ6_9NEOP|nr:jg13731 [Pararge aegeria aegeria]
MDTLYFAGGVNLSLAEARWERQPKGASYKADLDFSVEIKSDQPFEGLAKGVFIKLVFQKERRNVALGLAIDPYACMIMSWLEQRPDEIRNRDII